MHVFVSYSRYDQQTVDALVPFLEAEGYTCWVDRANLRHGRWPPVVEKALLDCSAVVLIVSKEAMQSKWVQRELSIAGDADKPIVPIEIERTPVPEPINQVIWQLQRINAVQIPPQQVANEIVEALVAADIRAVPMDLEDPVYLQARELFQDKQYGLVIPVLEAFIRRRPQHLAAVSMLITAHYNSGNARVLEEECRGLRPSGSLEIVDEFSRAEEIATIYMAEDWSDAGDVNFVFKSRVWETLGRISSFVGRHDDAFKRLRASAVADPDYTRPLELIEELQRGIRGRGRRTERMERLGFAYPEPAQYARWHSLAFPFTPGVRSDGKVTFPSFVSDEWQVLWMIDHNIGQLERFDDGENAERILERCLNDLDKLESSELISVGFLRVASGIALALAHKQLSSLCLRSLRSTCQKSIKHRSKHAQHIMTCWNAIPGLSTIYYL